MGQWHGKVDDDLDILIGEELVHCNGLHTVLRRFLLRCPHVHVGNGFYPDQFRSRRAL